MGFFIILLYTLFGAFTLLMLKTDDNINLTDRPVEVIMFWPGFLILYTVTIITDHWGKE